jgi:hypothetical protein
VIKSTIGILLATIQLYIEKKYITIGLVEKRAIKSFQDTKFIELEKEINTIAGYPIEFQVDWDTLAAADYADRYEEYFTDIYFKPIIESFKFIAADDMGKEALKEILKKIHITNDGTVTSEVRAYNLDAGVLTVNHDPVVNAHHIDYRTKKLTEVLSSKM